MAVVPDCQEYWKMTITKAIIYPLIGKWLDSFQNVHTMEHYVLIWKKVRALCIDLQGWP